MATFGDPVATGAGRGVASRGCAFPLASEVPTRRILIVLALSVTALLSFTAPGEAQRYRGSDEGYAPVNRRTPVNLGDGLPDIPGGFTLCRLAYTSPRGHDGSGNGWPTDFPNADRNLMTRLGELTPTPVSLWSHGEPGYAVVRVTDAEAYQCPFLYATDVGELGLYPDEVAAMRDFLLKGGLLWVDDYWGSAAWNDFAREMEKVVPEFAIVDLPLDHPLFSIVYNIPTVPQVPSIQFWRFSAGGTSELGRDSATPHLRAIMDDGGRILVLITHNTDISDGWEREGEDPEFFYLFSPDSYAVGIDVTVWMMTH
ncbi:MAG: DUF4159 domain-containing protein [Gemmatimonadetes bacterium]|nr:DUF4159 domain-containing protein [Gemmatimonadota bacterium]